MLNHNLPCSLRTLAIYAPWDILSLTAWIRSRKSSLKTGHLDALEQILMGTWGWDACCGEVRELVDTVERMGLGTGGAVEIEMPSQYWEWEDRQAMAQGQNEPNVPEGQQGIDNGE
jgi:hypothetical protein